MKWFFVVNNDASAWFNDMIRSAVLSAKETGLLEPHCITDDASGALFDWLKREGVVIHVGELPFKHRLYADDVIEANRGSPYRAVNASGAYLKILIPQFADAGEPVMYTDCDILFLPTLSFEGVAFDYSTMNAVPEIAGSENAKQDESGNFNSGVMIFDPQLFRDNYNAFLEELERRKYFFHGDPGFYDQGLFNVIFRGTWKIIPDTLNWRPYWGLSPAASIIHFHGPKPEQVRRIMHGTPGDLENPGLIALYDNAPAAYRHYLALFDAVAARAVR